MEEHVIPFLTEFKHHLPEDLFFPLRRRSTWTTSRRGVSFKIGDGTPTAIATTFGNVVVIDAGTSGPYKGIAFVYPPDAEPHISNSGRSDAREDR
jgi:hypothetical protein